MREGDEYCHIISILSCGESDLIARGRTSLAGNVNEADPSIKKISIFFCSSLLFEKKRGKGGT